jgi:ATP/maltotriose-dependent transcriptional regulator MalT
VIGLGVRSRLLARKGQASAARALAEEADSLARTTDSPWIQGDAALNLAEVLHLAGDRTRATEMTQWAIECYQRNGATARVARARRLTAAWTSGSSPASG